MEKFLVEMHYGFLLHFTRCISFYNEPNLTLKKDYLDYRFFAVLQYIEKKKLILARRHNMSINYDKLWKLLIDKKMNRTALKEASGISFNVLAKMGKGEAVSMESMLKVCKALDCDISDVMEIERETT
jgi:DNA (cytosine-5)-methyltransferase 1